MAYTPPEKIGKWSRVNRLGNGAFGDAWVYADSADGYAVIKFLFRSEEPITVTKQRFKKEYADFSTTIWTLIRHGSQQSYLVDAH